MARGWHALTVQEALTDIGADQNKGLSDQEALDRLQRFGSNELAVSDRVSPLRMLMSQFKDFMVIILLIATAISGFLGEYADAVTIMIIVILNAGLGFVQEYRAERSLEALRVLTAPESRVVRGGQERRVPAAQLVPGDIILLEEGDKVPADLRLIYAVNLEIEESSLTGESVAVKKQESTVFPANAPLGDRRNMAYLGTAVTRGRGRGLVVSTGMATEMGQIAGMIQEAGQEETPLQRRLGHLGKALVIFCLAICAVVVAVGIARGEAAYQMFLAGVSLAVAAIPESLPALVTIALAIGVQRMIKRNAIVRKLPAVETLGCATVICADKTGTLTQNQMTVRSVVSGDSIFEVSGEGYDPKGEFTGPGDKHSAEFGLFMKAAALCNNAVLTKGRINIGGLFRDSGSGRLSKGWSIMGDPTEGALLVMAAKAGFWRERLEKKEIRLHEISFNSERKRMTVLYRQDRGTVMAYMKGAPDVVLELCSHVYQGGAIVPLTEAKRQRFMRQNEELAAKALRVLAFAARELPATAVDQTEDSIEQNMVFLGLAGMIDPPRPSAYKAVQTCHRAGIKVIMITGDHQLTARAVGQELGIIGRDDLVLTGLDLDSMTDNQFRRVADRVQVYARLSPKHKLQIVRALKQAGHVVAMTGDGVNDAPAVKEADIGIAMGTSGSDVTKEASSMVLTDDNFTSIVAAVEEGRGIYENIRKFIRYLLSCNVGEVLTVFLAVLIGLPLPLVPIQILWMNLVTDSLPAMALGVDPNDRDIMHRRPRQPGENIFSNGLAWRIGLSGTVIGCCTLLAYWIGLAIGELALARTMAFNTLVFLQLFYVFACRSEHHNIFDVGIFSNTYLIGAVIISAALQLMVNYLPCFQPVFQTVSLGAGHWVIILAIALSPTLLGHLAGSILGLFRHKVMYLRA